MVKKKIEEYLKNSLSDYRFKHTVGVAQTAVKLADWYGTDPAKAEIAGLVHDIARDFSDRFMLEMCCKYGILADETENHIPALLHGKVAAGFAADRFNISETDILDPVRYHTTGRKNMTIPEKILFLADMIEPGRAYSGVEDLRRIAWVNLDQAVLTGLNSTVRYVLERGLMIHPDSILARNSLIMEG